MSKPKNAVMLLTTPEGWMPSRVHDVPPEFDAAEWYAKRLSLKAACTVARAYNAGHLQPGKFERKWMVVIRAINNGTKHAGYLRSVSGASEGGAK